MAIDVAQLPQVRGKMIENAPLARYTWFRVGGPAEVLFLPADADDLADFLKELPRTVPLTVLGFGSNVIVRDGGLAGVVIRLAGGYWGEIERIDETSLLARSGALDLSIAKCAAKHGVSGLSFLSGIPGSIGGAIRTNAGCYGKELRDVLSRVTGITRDGEIKSWQGSLVDHGLPEIGFDYRHTDFPNDVVITEVLLSGDETVDADTLLAEIAGHQARRADTQPIREKTGGSTFANPDPPGTVGQRSAWKLIDQSGCRGLRVGGAQVSEKHCNFLINTGEATASDLEALGELVRARVLDNSG
ncbi:MAG: UDP-N-acetylmuramate dehydrogenase, partial [Pseudomonadota bacterium]